MRVDDSLHTLNVGFSAATVAAVARATREAPATARMVSKVE
jgi:hypothetical protein